MVLVPLKDRVTNALEEAGFESATPPLTRRGYHLIEDPADRNVLSFLEIRFKKPVREGVVIYPFGFGDFSDVKAEARAYLEALRLQGFSVDLLVIEPPPANWAVYVFVRR